MCKQEIDKASLDSYDKFNHAYNKVRNAVELIEIGVYTEKEIDLTSLRLECRILCDALRKTNHSPIDVQMPIETETVGQSSDDARSTAFVVWLTETIMRLQAPPTEQGYRFQNVDVCQGGTISSAIFRIRGWDYCQRIGNCHNKVLGINLDNVPTWSAANKPTTAPRTAAFINFNSTADFMLDHIYRVWSLDVTTIVQEIVNRAGWTPNNAMAMVINPGTYGRLNYIDLIAWDHAHYPPSNLYITYTCPAGGIMEPKSWWGNC